MGVGSNSRRTAVLFTYHYAGSKRKAGFHWLAEGFLELGWRVVFVTAPISRLSRLVRDERLRYPVLAEANRLVPVRPGLDSYVLYTGVHPVRDGPFRIPGPVMSRLCRSYARADLGALEPELAGADAVVFEATAALVLVPRIRELTSGALVYRVADDLACLRLHPQVQAIEEEVAPMFDLVSAAAPEFEARFARLTRATLDPPGLQKGLFDADVPSPYERGQNAVFVGQTLLDRRAVESIAVAHPDWRFHVIGDLGYRSRLANVRTYAERPFVETIPFVKHADVGLLTKEHHGPNADISASLKWPQYRYCGLPTVAPSFLSLEGPHVFRYEHGNPASAARAFAEAAAAGKDLSLRSSVASWSDVAAGIVGALCRAA